MRVQNVSNKGPFSESFFETVLAVAGEAADSFGLVFHLPGVLPFSFLGSRSLGYDLGLDFEADAALGFHPHIGLTRSFLGLDFAAAFLAFPFELVTF